MQASLALKGPALKGPHMMGRVCLLGIVAVLMTSTWGQVNSSPPGVNDSPAPLVFTDVTRQAGLIHKITNGDKLSEYLIDINGQGACFLDYNNDGFQDIFLVNGTSRKLEASGQHPHDYLFRNNGDGTFTDVTREAHIGDSGWHSGCAVGDYNNELPRHLRK